MFSFSIQEFKKKAPQKTPVWELYAHLYHPPSIDATALLWTSAVSANAMELQKLLKLGC